MPFAAPCIWTGRSIGYVGRDPARFERPGGHLAEVQRINGVMSGRDPTLLPTCP